MKPVLRKELIKVVAGDAAGNTRETRANEVGVLIADCMQPGVNLASAATHANDAVKHHHRTARLKDRAEAFENFRSERCELGPAMVNDG